MSWTIHYVSEPCENGFKYQPGNVNQIHDKEWELSHEECANKCRENSTCKSYEYRGSKTTKSQCRLIDEAIVDTDISSDIFFNCRKHGNVIKFKILLSSHILMINLSRNHCFQDFMNHFRVPR